MREKIDLFNLLRKISFKPDLSQRQLARDLGFSLGKLNYCMKLLNEKGLLKIKHLKKRKNKINYVKKYVLTKKGIKHRINLTIEFMKRNMKEYDELKREIDEKRNN
tara:strand:- start:2444 stop:2761 length:318 start_codon:yes stop_codon:yes gene_type:complete